MQKAQFSMEALMTWGWVIVILTAVIGALFYFGIFNITDFLPSKCELTPGLACDDYKVEKNTIKIKVTNSLGKKIVVRQFETQSEHGVTCSGAGSWHVKNGETSGEITCAGSDNIENEKIKFNVRIEYEFEDDPGQMYTARGLIFDEVGG